MKKQNSQVIKTLLSVFFALSLVGCVTPSSNDESTSIPVVNEPLPPYPVCKTKDQCEFMWRQTRQLLSYATGMPIKTYTDSYIETAGVHDIRDRYAGYATKTANSNGTHTIVPNIICRGRWCDNYAYDTTKRIILSIKEQGDGFIDLQRKKAALEREKKR